MTAKKMLTECQDKETGKIVEIHSTDRRIPAKLMSLGIIPGSGFCLLRREPAFLLRTGYTMVALDRALAACIWVDSNS